MIARMHFHKRILTSALSCISIYAGATNAQESLQRGFYNKNNQITSEKSECIAQRNEIAKAGWYPPVGWAPLGSVLYIADGNVNLFVMVNRVYPTDKFCQALTKGRLGAVEADNYGGKYQWVLESGRLCNYTLKSDIYEKTCYHKIGNKNPEAWPPPVTTTRQG
jgi:hypothetical protein